MHLRKLPSGNWRWIVQKDGVRRHGTCETKAQAKTAGAEAELELGKIPRGANVTYDEMLRSHIVEQGYSPRRVKDLTSVVDRVPDDVLAWRIREIEPAMIVSMYARLRKAGWKPNTLKALHMVSSSAFSRAVGYGWLPINPFYKRAPSVPTKRRKGPPVATVKKILAEMSGDAQLYLRVKAQCGRRRGEIIGLTWAGVDFENNTIDVGQSVDWVDGQLVISEGKTEEQGHRVISIDPSTTKLLKAVRQRQVELALASGMASPTWVFSNTAGASPWRGDYISREFRRARDRAGFADIHEHDLRHYVASSMIHARADITETAGRLGIDPNTLLAHYAREQPGRDKATAKRLAKAIDF